MDESTWMGVAGGKEATARGKFSDFSVPSGEYREILFPLFVALKSLLSWRRVHRTRASELITDRSRRRRQCYWKYQIRSPTICPYLSASKRGARFREKLASFLLSRVARLNIAPWKEKKGKRNASKRKCAETSFTVRKKSWLAIERMESWKGIVDRVSTSQ